MKLDNLNVVNDLMKVRKSCEIALNDAKDFIDKADSEKCSGGHIEHTKVFQNYYYGSFTEHNDGSGVQVSLIGCYVGKVVALSIVSILVEQIKTINEDLQELGVEL